MSSKVWLRVWTKRRLQRTDSGSRLDEDVEQFEFPLWFTDTAITVHCCWWLLTRLVLLLSPLLFMLLHFSSSLVDRQPRLPFFLSLQLANVLFIHYLSNYWPTLETLVCLFLSLFCECCSALVCTCEHCGNKKVAVALPFPFDQWPSPTHRMAATNWCPFYELFGDILVCVSIIFWRCIRVAQNQIADQFSLNGKLVSCWYGVFLFKCT